MKPKQQIIYDEDIIWTFNKELDNYINQHGEMKKRPRPRKSKGKREINTSNNLIIENFLSTKQSSKYFIKYYKQELLMFFISDLVYRYNLILRLKDRGKLDSKFFNKYDNSLKGIYYSYDELEMLLGRDYKNTITFLKNDNLINIKEFVNIKGNTIHNKVSHCKFFTPNSELLNKIPSILKLTKEYSIKSIIKFKELRQNKNLDKDNLIPIINKNLMNMELPQVEYFTNRKNDIYNVSIDTFGLRTHSPLSNLEKTYRKFIKIDGEYLEELDIPNSQMTSLSIYFDDKLEGISKFKKLCLNGSFYESLDECGLFKKYGVIDRNTAKSFCFTLFFGPLTFIELKKYNEDLYNELKRLKNGDLGYRTVSQVTQRIESKVFNRIIKQIDYNNIKFGHVYDSIIMKSKDKQLVSDIIKQEYFNMYNVKINFK